MNDAVSVATLYLLTGPWASGKSSLIPHLARSLPEVVVFDWDVLLPGLSAATGKDARREPSTWDGLRAMWVAIIRSVLDGGRDVLLCGPAIPEDFARGSLASVPIRCAYLNCPDDVLVERLRARGVAEPEVAEEVATMAGLRATRYHPLEVGERTPSQIAEEAVVWIRAGQRGRPT